MAVLLALLAVAPADYSAPANWLCLLGHAGACDASQDATIVQPDGSMTLEKLQPAKDAPVDCFYVYPTVSLCSRWSWCAWQAGRCLAQAPAPARPRFRKRGRGRGRFKPDGG
jgi:hypothetical protein